MSPSEQIQHIADVPVALDVELERKPMLARDILQLTEGSIIRLSRSAGENIDIRVGDTLLGYGEIVILEENMGVRITDFHEED